MLKNDRNYKNEGNGNFCQNLQKMSTPLTKFNKIYAGFTMNKYIEAGFKTQIEAVLLP